MIYLINTKTKEHIDATALGDSRYEQFARSPGWVVQMADPDGWIEWQSSEYERPVPGGSRCEIRLSNGDGFIISDPEDWDWSKGGDQWIIAYRPILDADKMKRGKTEVETIKLNGWGPGDILEGREGKMTDRLLIVSMGDEKFVAKWDYGATGEYDREGGNVTLSCREWCKVGRIDEPPAWDGEGLPPVGAHVEYPTGRGVVKLPPDRDGVTVVEDDGSKCADGAGTYKRVAACACEPIRSEEDRAVEQMAMDLVEKDADAEYTMDGLRTLYRAGYRKTGGEG